MNRSLRAVRIAGLGASVPERLLTNADLQRIVDTSEEWIVTRTGIRERHLAGPDVATSDLATEAARQALARASVAPEDIDLVIVATVTPDHTFPATACLVQRDLGAYRAAAFDLEAACSGFIYALSVGTQFVATGTYDTVLVIGAETLSRITDWSDRNTCVLFGDGAGAAVLRPSVPGQGILSTYLGANGQGASLMNLPAGGSRRPACTETVARREHFIKMNGSEVFKFAVKMMGDAAQEALRLAGLDKEDIDYLVPHQANLRIIEAAARRFDLPMERVITNLDRFGNMSSASVPVALEGAVDEGRIREGDVVLLVAFGAGLTWGACALRW